MTKGTIARVSGQVVVEDDQPSTGYVARVSTHALVDDDQPSTAYAARVSIQVLVAAGPTGRWGMIQL